MRLMAGLLPLLCACLGVHAADRAWALDPARSIGQSKHTRWGIDDGAPIFMMALAQGRDGYLWIGGRDGLYRFDGVTFEAIPPQRRFPGRSAVTATMVARDGTVWAGYGAGGVAVYRNGVLRDSAMPGSDAFVMALVQAGDGAVWAALGRRDLPLARYSDGRWEEVGANWGLPPDYLINLIAARDGSLWLSTLKSVLVLRKGARRFERVNEIPAGHAALSEDRAGRIWLSDDSGSRAIAGVEARRGASPLPYPTPGAPRAVRTFFDRDGNLWGMTGTTGVYRVRSPRAAGESSRAAAAARVELFQAKDGLTSDNSLGMLEDREGSIWIGTGLGLNRFRPANVVVEPALTRIATWGYKLLGASDGSVYVGQADSVYRIRPGGRPEPLVENVRETEAICEGPDGTVWIVLQDRILQFRNGRIGTVTRPSTTDIGIHDCAVDRHDVLWLSADRDGMFRRSGGHWEQLLVPPPQGDGAPLVMIADRSRRLLVHLDSGLLARIDFPRRNDLVLRQSGLTPTIATLYDGARGLLLGGSFGLARWRGGRFQLLSSDRFPMLGGPTGIVETPDGETWLMGRAGIVRVSTDDLNRAFANPGHRLAPTILDFRDGLPGVRISDGQRDAVRGGDGRLWFATIAGTVWVDPSRLSRNVLAPAVVISALKAGGATYRDPSSVTLPKGTSSAEIDYTALSLSIPERVRFRYRLEGVDKGWVDPGARRQAFYTNLGPGEYRFRVIAANNDGLWNRKGATLELVIPPTFLQSTWFLVICALGVAALLWMAYSARVRRVTARLKAGLEERLAERERIARELHDTLLQGFQGLVLQFQAVADRIEPGQPVRALVDQALDRADAVLIEGRDRVRDLRHSEDVDLAQALIDVAGDLVRDRTIGFDLVVEGSPRALHPMVREELQRIGEEAIRNAFEHAQATAVEATLTYRRRQLRFGIRDDGIGIPADVASAGERTGHFGLVGMRERALRIGGTLAITSRQGAGTEVLLSIPGRAAYASRSGRWRFIPFRAAKLEG